MFEFGVCLPLSSRYRTPLRKVSPAPKLSSNLLLPNKMTRFVTSTSYSGVSLVFVNQIACLKATNAVPEESSSYRGLRGGLSVASARPVAPAG